MTVISIIIPIRNGAKWISDCMKSIKNQTILDTDIQTEIVVHNDGSTDRTEKLLEEWAEYFNERNIPFTVSKTETSLGVGAAKNEAVKRSSGEYLCFQDIDDIMLPRRIMLQYQACLCDHNVLVGSKIIRNPPDSTPRLVHWANNLTDLQLRTQIYTSNGPTLLMPTWFCHRSVYDRVGGFKETGSGTPEDLIFFYDHLDEGGDLHRVNEELLIYTYHENATTFSVNRDIIWKIQLERLEREVLPQWKEFMIWNAGKAGRRLLRALKPENQKKVTAFCDVDINKIDRKIEFYCPDARKVTMVLPVLHYTEAKAPLLICVKQDLTNGEFEKNLNSLKLTEGIDYVLFS